jgi:predicted Rossmann fold nucleotide-binding protein DprA/Smf involved in DNA uptake
MKILDIALDLGKEIYAIPGDIFEYKNYLANFAIKQGAIPICSRCDMQYIIRENKDHVL